MAIQIPFRDYYFTPRTVSAEEFDLLKAALAKNPQTSLNLAPPAGGARWREIYDEFKRDMLVLILLVAAVVALFWIAFTIISAYDLSETVYFYLLIMPALMTLVRTLVQMLSITISFGFYLYFVFKRRKYAQTLKKRIVQSNNYSDFFNKR